MARPSGFALGDTPDGPIEFKRFARDYLTPHQVPVTRSVDEVIMAEVLEIASG